MKKVLVFAILLSLGLFLTVAQAQENKNSGIGDGGSCNDCANFETPKIYLDKSQDQIIRLDASFFEYKINDRKLSKATININLYAAKFNYLDLIGDNRFNVQDKNLVVITADNIKFSPISIAYFNFRERIVNGKKKGFVSFKPQVKDGKILDEKGLEVNGTLGEEFRLFYEPAEFKKFSSAKKITVKIANKSFELNKEQVKEIVRIAQKASIK